METHLEKLLYNQRQENNLISTLSTTVLAYEALPSESFFKELHKLNLKRKKITK